MSEACEAYRVASCDQLKVLVIGKGVVGDATGNALEQRGHDVVYHDPPKGIEGSAEGCDVALICVNTPMEWSEGQDLTQVDAVAKWLDKKKFEGLVGMRSTVVPQMLEGLMLGHCLQWFAWPEFLRAAHARWDAMHPCRIVVGCTEEQKEIVCRLLPQTRGKVLFTTPEAAMFVKYATNAIHAVNVGLANELAGYAACLGLDWNALLPPLAEGSDTIPSNIVVTAEGGFGGACLPKDVAALLYGDIADLPILDACHAANRARRPECYC